MASSIQVEDVNGSDCSGADGASNRELTLSELGTTNTILLLLFRIQI